MDISVAGMVSGVLQMQQAQSIQQGQIAVLKKSMDIAEASVAQLIESTAVQPPLASSGNLGTRLNVYA